MDETPRGPREYLDLLRRRRWQMAVPAAALLAASVLAAFVYPSSYRSTATILIEEQEVPADLVRSTVTSYADQRIQSIKQQIMSRTNLWRIVEQHGLYAKQRERRPTEAVLKRMVDDIDIQVISAEVVDQRTGRSTNATIAFTLSYEGEDPGSTQKVATELTSLFLAENLKTRQRHAQETTSFLKQEAESLAGRIQSLERKIAAFKQRADGALPELFQINMQLLDRAERDLTEADREVRTLEERKISLEGVLATIDPGTPIITSGGERILDSAERLKALRAQYTSSAAYLAPDHPDLIKMRKELAALGRETGDGASADQLGREREAAFVRHAELEAERARLAELRERYADDHPDVARALKTVASLEREHQSAERDGRPAVAKPDNPAYINIAAQFSAVVSDLGSLQAKKQELSRTVRRYAARIEATPALEREYHDLTRDRDNSVEKYHEIRSKLLEAQVSEGLEAQRKGERFSLIDPPLLPETPVKPNRPAIFILGLVAAMAGGLGWGAAAEHLDRSVRSMGALERIAGVAPLAVIPYLSNSDDAARARRRTRLLIGLAAGAALTVLLLAHLLWLPLDVIGATALRKLGL